MRQAGIVASAGVYALRHHVERLDQDDQNALHFSQLRSVTDLVTIDPNEVQNKYCVHQPRDLRFSMPARLPRSCWGRMVYVFAFWVPSCFASLPTSTPRVRMRGLPLRPFGRSWPRAVVYEVG